jgi:hypothetical protein
VVSGRAHSGPRWGGEDLKGLTILVRSGPEAGETIQFLRYLPMLSARVHQLVLDIPGQLVRFAAGLPVKNLRIVVAGRSTPATDVECPLHDLPRLMGIMAETIPGPVPYVGVRRALVERWAVLFEGEARLKVGLIWTAHRNNRVASDLSVSLERLRQLSAVPNIAWYSLQGGLAAGELMEITGSPIVDLGARLTDFTDTAAAIMNLDLLITVDDAAAHVAGALAQPAWIILPFHSGQPWIERREDSPWYPSLRLYRQTNPGDWDGVLAQIAESLSRLVARHAERVARR